MPVLAVAGIAALIAISGCLAFYFLSGQKPATVASTQPPLHAQSVMIPRLSIVVLPFANLSGDPNRDYFADGITENLTSDLSRLAGSFVIARNTAFTYKSKNVDAKQIG